jgi:hypothetical protein
MGVSGQHHAPAALYPRGKDPRHPLDRRLGGPRSRSGKVEEKSFAYVEDRTPVVQFVANYYTEWATPAPAINKYLHINTCPVRMQEYENKTLYMLDKTMDDER